MYREKRASRIKSRLQGLENDRTWRLWKTVYITIAVMLVVATGIVTSLMNTRQQCVGMIRGGLWGERYTSCTSAFSRGEAVSPALTIIIAGTGFVAAYYLALPKIYIYLKGSRTSKPTDMS